MACNIVQSHATACKKIVVIVFKNFKPMISFMKCFRKWISIIVLSAFVFATMPMAAHASIPHDTAKTSEVSNATPKHENCHHHDKTASSVKTSKSEHCPPGKNCCEKDCKCIGGSCNGSSSLLSPNGIILGFSSVSVKHSGILTRINVSDHDGRIKRPPRA